MRLAVMQPYFLPYIGYFQLIAAVDAIIVYDNIKYTKKGWINRNRLLLNGADAIFSLPLKKDSDSKSIAERELAADFDRQKLLGQFRGAYIRAPFFKSVYPFLERLVHCREQSLFHYLLSSLEELCGHLGIRTRIITSSNVVIDHGLKAQEKVLALCSAMGARTYINPIGGMDLYQTDRFLGEGINLKFLKPGPLKYNQFAGEFVPWLSIIDVLMFNSLDTVREHVTNSYELI
ncbi:MAG TPA: WbqC family protein [Bellilinea sp.]|jgi:hypothetical protein|nr:WbqC family protein [Bellilinea sp.]